MHKSDPQISYLAWYYCFLCANDIITFYSDNVIYVKVVMKHREMMKIKFGLKVYKDKIFFLTGPTICSYKTNRERFDSQDNGDCVCCLVPQNEDIQYICN